MSASIIIADDDPVVHHILGSVLKTAGHSVGLCKTGAEFLSALEDHAAHSSLPDLLFLDLQLPDMTGAEIVPVVRKTAPTMRIVVISANSEDETLSLFPGIAFDGYLEKPFAPQKVLDLVMTLINAD